MYILIITIVLLLFIIIKGLIDLNKKDNPNIGEGFNSVLTKIITVIALAFLISIFVSIFAHYEIKKETIIITYIDDSIILLNDDTEIKRQDNYIKFTNKESYKKIQSTDNKWIIWNFAPMVEYYINVKDIKK